MRFVVFLLSTISIGVGTCRFFCDAPQDWELGARGVRLTVPVSSPGSSYWYCNNDSSRQPIKHRHIHSSVVEFFCRCCREREKEREREDERKIPSTNEKKAKADTVDFFSFLSFFVYLLSLSLLNICFLLNWDYDKGLLRCRSAIRSVGERMYVLLLTSRERYEKRKCMCHLQPRIFPYQEKKKRSLGKSRRNN